MIEAGKADILPLCEKNQGEFAKTLWNVLFDIDGPRVVSRKPTERELFMGKMFRGFWEIDKSLETLEDIAFYVGRFPFQKTRVSPERYLQFHVEAWFAEVYILRERLDSYLRVLERQYKSDPGLPAIRARVKRLTDWLVKTLEGVSKTRGQHVHSVRFNNDGISRLGTINLLIHGSEDDLTHVMRLYHRIERRKVKKVWKSRLVANNEQIRKLLDIFFENLFPVVFDEGTNALKYPKRLSV